MIAFNCLFKSKDRVELSSLEAEERHVLDILTWWRSIYVRLIGGRHMTGVIDRVTRSNDSFKHLFSY